MASNVCFDSRFESTPGEKLGDEITELTAYINAATCHLLELIREFDENEYWAEQGFLSCAHWLNFKCGMAPPTTSRPWSGNTAACRGNAISIRQM